MATSRSSLLIPSEFWLPWVVSTNPGLLFFGAGVSCWDVEILSCIWGVVWVRVPRTTCNDVLWIRVPCHCSPQGHHVVTGMHPVHFWCYLLFVSCSLGVRLGHLAVQGTLDHLHPPDLTMLRNVCQGALFVYLTSSGGGAGRSTLGCCVRPVSSSMSSMVMLLSSGLALDQLSWLGPYWQCSP